MSDNIFVLTFGALGSSTRKYSKKIVNDNSTKRWHTQRVKIKAMHLLTLRFGLTRFGLALLGTLLGLALLFDFHRARVAILVAITHWRHVGNHLEVVP